MRISGLQVLGAVEFELITESKHGITSRALIIATGTQRISLNVPGEKAFVGNGVSYCVDCDGNFYKGENVAVIGGESAAVVRCPGLDPDCEKGASGLRIASSVGQPDPEAFRKYSSGAYGNESERNRRRKPGVTYSAFKRLRTCSVRCVGGFSSINKP